MNPVFPSWFAITAVCLFLLVLSVLTNGGVKKLKIPGQSSVVNAAQRFARKRNKRSDPSSFP